MRRKGFPATQVTFDARNEGVHALLHRGEAQVAHAQEWEPIVRFEEPLADCAKKFNIASTGAK